MDDAARERAQRRALAADLRVAVRWHDSQATAVRSLVADAGATWLGVAAAIDGSAPDVRRRLEVRSLLHERALSS